MTKSTKGISGNVTHEGSGDIYGYVENLIIQNEAGNQVKAIEELGRQVSNASLDDQRKFHELKDEIKKEKPDQGVVKNLLSGLQKSLGNVADVAKALGAISKSLKDAGILDAMPF